VSSVCGCAVNGGDVSYYRAAGHRDLALAGTGVGLRLQTDTHFLVRVFPAAAAGTEAAAGLAAVAGKGSHPYLPAVTVAGQHSQHIWDLAAE